MVIQAFGEAYRLNSLFRFTLKFVHKMRNSNSQTTDNQVYQVVIDGIVYRGSRSYIQQVIADDRENRG